MIQTHKDFHIFTLIMAVHISFCWLLISALKFSAPESYVYINHELVFMHIVSIICLLLLPFHIS